MARKQLTKTECQTSASLLSGQPENVALDPGPGGLANRLPWHGQCGSSVRSQAALGRCPPRRPSRWRRRGARRSAGGRPGPAGGGPEHAQCVSQTANQMSRCGSRRGRGRSEAGGVLPVEVPCQGKTVGRGICVPPRKYKAL